MTVLAVAKEVAKVIGVEVPETLTSNTSREMIELLEIMNEMATQISDGHDWQKLAKVATITGDGATEAFDLPSDYDRFRDGSEVWSSTIQAPFTHIKDLNEWLGLDVQAFDFIINAWTVYGDQFHIKPDLASAATAKYFYQSDLIVLAADTTLKTTFTLDTDVFRLSERLLKLATIWRWKEHKGQPYAEDMADYEVLKSRLVARDGGSSAIRVGRVRMSHDAKTAYPTNIGVS